MVETPSTGGIENIKQRDELTSQVSSTILKLFFKKQLEKSGESTEKSEQEININIQGSIKGPDKFGNYVLSFDGKKILLDENLTDITGLEFAGIMPYNDRYYICDIGKKCVFFDTQTGNVIEFAEFGHVVRPKIYGKDELCDDEFMADLCSKSVQLYSDENRKALALGFDAFLHKYFQGIIGKDIDIEMRAKEASEFGKESKSMLLFLMGAYEYMYNGKITNNLAGKDSNIWTKLKESDLLKEMYPDLYLAMRELDFIKNVLINEKGEICGYVVVKDGVCSYIQIDGTVSQYDDFIGPDKYGNIITRQGNKKYFVNSEFQYPFCGFDEIIGPDKNGNYVLRIKNKWCLVSSNGGKVLSMSKSESTGNEPDFISECFDSIQGPDKNDNYVIKSSRGYFLVNSKLEKISDIYLSLGLLPETGKYKAFNMSGTAMLDINGGMIS